MILLLAIVTLTADETTLTVEPEQARLSLRHRGTEAAVAHPEGGLLLGAAERPAIVAGGGAMDAGEPIRELAELLQAPVIMTHNGRGILSDRECKKERLGGEVICQVW